MHARYRLVSFAALVLLMGSSLCSAAADPPRSIVVLEAKRDGSIEIEGRRYHDSATLKAEMIGLSLRRSRPFPKWVVEPGATFDAVARAEMLLQDAANLNGGYTLYAPAKSTPSKIAKPKGSQ